MRIWHYVTVMASLVLVFVGLILWLSMPGRTYSQEDSIISPLPKHLTMTENNQVRILDFFQPLIEHFTGSDEETLAYTSKAALMYDLDTNKTLFEKNATQRLPMASLTKIMTAIIALENPYPGDTYYVDTTHMVGEDSMGLTPGETVSLEELMYGLMLPSGNDASEVLASHFPGGRQEFLLAMNEKAVALGLEDTRFSNPSGLQGDGEQYTTAHDLLVITKYAIDRFPLFREVVSTYQYEIPATETHKYFFLENATNLISTYPGVKGVKTGFTPEAGLCLVTYLEYDNHRVVGILLNSENRRMEMKELLDFSLTELGSTPPPFEEAVF